MDKQQLYKIFKTALLDWLDDNATLRAAALSFFIILPLPTLLLLVNIIFAYFLGETQAVQLLIQQISAVVGPAVAALFSQLITNTGSPFTSPWTAVVVIAFSIGGAIGAFSVLRDAMDCIWEVKPKNCTLSRRLRQKIVPFMLVSSLGLIVVAWTTITAGILNAIHLISVNEVLTFIVLEAVQVILSFGVATLLFAIIYKLIPEAKVHWHDVALAAVVTGVAFTVTNYIFGAYIQTFTFTTVAGTAGALLIILLWIFVLNEIVLFGAELSKVYATTIGTHSLQHLPEVVQKIIEPLQKLDEKIEDSVKDEVVKIEQPPDETETASKQPETTVPPKGITQPKIPQEPSESEMKKAPPKKKNEKES
jgi:membrane protein